MFIYFLAFLPPVCFAVSNILDSHISNNVFQRIQSVVFYSVVTNCLVIPFLFIFGVPVMPGLSVVPLILLAAALEIFYQVPYYISMRKVDTSVTAALFSLGKIMIPLLAFLIVGEKVRGIQYLGFFIIVGFSILVSIDNFRNLKVNKALGLMFVSSLCLSLKVVITKRILMELDWISTIFWVNIFTTISILTFLFSRVNRSEIFESMSSIKKRVGLFMVNEFFNQVAVLAHNFVLAALPVIVISAIDSTQALIVLLLCFIISYITNHKVKEKLDTISVVKKIICFIFIILGIILTI